MSAAVWTVRVRGPHRTAHYWCPVCDDLHAVSLDDVTGWKWNGSMDKPTITPSVRSYTVPRTGPENTRCHVYITDGMVQVLGDSPKMGGQTVPLPPLPAWALDGEDPRA